MSLRGAFFLIEKSIVQLKLFTRYCRVKTQASVKTGHFYCFQGELMVFLFDRSIRRKSYPAKLVLSLKKIRPQ